MMLLRHRLIPLLNGFFYIEMFVLSLDLILLYCGELFIFPCARARARVCVRVCVRVCACMRACVRACMHVFVTACRNDCK